MTAVDTIQAALYGNPPASDWKPTREGVLQAFTELQTQLNNLSLGTVSVVKDTRAHLDADLAHDADTLALVYADTTATNNDLYVKVGASGSGSWTLIGAFAAVLQPYVTACIAQVTLANAAATLAGHYANDSTDVDVPGGSAGERGAKYWSIVAAAAATGAVAPNSVTVGRAINSGDQKRILLTNIPGPGNDAIADIIVPSNSVTSLPIGSVCDIVRTGGSYIRFKPDSVGAAVINGPSAGKVVVGDHASCKLLKEGTDQWRVYGVLASAPATAIAPKIWFDASDLSTMKQERTGAAATTAAVVGQPVGSWRNKGSLGGWAVIDADAKRPILQQSANGFYELLFDGVDDLLRLPAPALNLASIEIYLGVRYAGVGGTNAFSTGGGILSLAPATGNDYNVNTGMSVYFSSSGTSINWVGGGTGTGSTMIVSAGGVMTKNAHTVELRKTTPDAAKMTVDGNNGSAAPAQVNNSTATTSFGTQGGDLLIGARQGNGVVGWGNVAIRSIVITNEPVSDPSSIQAYEQSKTYGTVPVFPAIADTTALNAARATLINELFGGSGIPSDLATLAIESPNPLNGVATFTNLNKCEKMTIPGYAARPRLWTPNTPRNDVIFLVVAGHDAGWSANGISSFVMQPLLTANVRMCTFVLPGGPNDYTSGGPTQHESGSYTLKDWVGPVCIAINTLQNMFPSAAIHMTGISGGGWTTVISAAVDSRIAKSYPFVGSMPDMIYYNRDFEQRLNGLTADYLTLYTLAACPGRRHMQVLYENDPVAFSRAIFNTRPDYSVQLKTNCAAIGGGVYDLNWVNYNLHSYTSAFSTLVISELP